MEPILVVGLPILITAVVLGYFVYTLIRRSKRRWAVVSLAVGAVFLCCGLSTDIYQWLRLSQYEYEFRQLQHPPGTSLVASKKALPHYAANYCAYFVGELREYSGNRAEVIEFYTVQQRREPFSQELYILFVEDGGLTQSVLARKESFSWDSSAIRAAEDAISYHWDLSPSDLEGALYVVYFAHIGDSYFDYRCH